MGREIKRVPLDFDHPMGEVWSGFLMPSELHETKCFTCNGGGYSSNARHLHDRWYGYMPFDPAETGSTPLTAETPAVRAFAERNVTSAPDFYGAGEFAIHLEATRLAKMWNGQWNHHLSQDDVDALIAGNRLWDFTRRVVPGEGWQLIEPTPVVTAEQVNAWSIGGFGHDSINCMIVIRAACERAGWDATCADCGGQGSTEAYPGQRAEAEAWTSTGPPGGDGWQLWETVSEGSPVSPVFPTADDLATWMSNPDRGQDWVPGDVALRMVNEGWAPSMVFTPETGVISGVEYIGTTESGADR